MSTTTPPSRRTFGPLLGLTVLAIPALAAGVGQARAMQAGVWPGL